MIYLKLRELDIEVDDGICMLSGTVDSEEKRVLAEEVARNIQGISEVRNTITVRALGVVVTPPPMDLPSEGSGSDPSPSAPPSSFEGSEPPSSFEGSEPPEESVPGLAPSVEAATLGDP